MIGYAATEMFDANDLALWRLATALVERVPEKLKPRCHELARAVTALLIDKMTEEMVAVFLSTNGAMLNVVDGKYGAVEHSWIALSRRHILDVYTPGNVPLVQLRDFYWGIPEGRLYVPGEKRDDIDGAMVQKLMAAMKTKGETDGTKV